MVALLGASCGGARTGAEIGLVAQPPALQIERSPSPYAQVTIGPVQALVPDSWKAVVSTSQDDLRHGFVATPEPHAWGRMDGSAAGMVATWIDATRVGVPSDFYYLAATGPLFSGLTRSADCRAGTRRVFADNRPTFESGTPGSTGDYVASGEGTCHVGGHLTRWAYFVAAPGFGPLHRLGIPSSGLYVIVAVMPDSRRAPATLRRLLDHARFGGAGIHDFVAAIRASV